MTALSGGHLATDFASGAVPALLPFFAEKFDLSYTLTAVLMLAVLVSSSLMQPLFGIWSDRRGALWLLPAGIALGGIGLGLAAVAPSYGRCCSSRVPLGHRHRRVPPGRSEVRRLRERPQARERHVALQHRRQHRLRTRADHRDAARALARSRARRAAGAAPDRARARWPSLRVLPYLAQPPSRARAADAELVEGKDDVRAMLVLSGVIGLRSVAWFGLLTFVPLWVVSLGNSEAEGNRLLSLMLLSGAVGTLLLGPDRGPVRAPPHAARRAGAAGADDPALRPRRRPRRRGRPDGGRDLRRRHVRRSRWC